MRCEDFPCCGHSLDEGCPDFSRLNKCQDCGYEFHPANDCELYCLGCQSPKDEEIDLRDYI